MRQGGLYMKKEVTEEVTGTPIFTQQNIKKDCGEGKGKSEGGNYGDSNRRHSSIPWVGQDAEGW